MYDIFHSIFYAVSTIKDFLTPIDFPLVVKLPDNHVSFILSSLRSIINTEPNIELFANQWIRWCNLLRARNELASLILVSINILLSQVID